MDRLAATCEQIGKVSSKLRKVATLAAYLRDLSDDDFLLAVRFLSSGPLSEEPIHRNLFSVEEAARLSIGHATLREALQTVTGWDLETLRICYRESGDSGETIGLLVRGHTSEQPLTLHGANQIYQQLFRAHTAAQKTQILADTYRAYQASTIKFFVKIITGNLRIGLLSRMVEEAVAASCDVPHSAVRDANNRLGDLARVAIAARHGALSDIEARLFHPMDFMLARPLDRVEDLAEPAEWIVEDKYDGIRSQIHFDHGNVKIFSRGMEEITSGFPEIVDAFAKAEESALIDGEILAYRDGRALNFNVLQQRIARKRVRAALMAEVPVVFMAYDLLLWNGELHLHTPFIERRRLLGQLLSHPAFNQQPVVLSPQFTPITHAEIEALFKQARDRGNEGLLLKRLTSQYEPGKRTGSWYKLKRPYGTLDVVITAAEQGQGRRATVFSDYTFAVRSAEGFVNVGKAYSGLTDSEIKQLTKILRAASLDRFGRVMLVRPEIVLEVAFDGVQKSPRHKSGYALRFPRILRWREDKKPEDCDDLDRVKELYEASIYQGQEA